MTARRLKRPAVAVWWGDAYIVEEQFEEDDCPNEPAVQVTVGFLVKRDKKGVTLAMEYADDEPEQLRTRAFIPAGMIRRVQRLR